MVRPARFEHAIVPIANPIWVPHRPVPPPGVIVRQRSASDRENTMRLIDEKKRVLFVGRRNRRTRFGQTAPLSATVLFRLRAARSGGADHRLAGLR